MLLNCSLYRFTLLPSQQCVEETRIYLHFNKWVRVGMTYKKMSRILLRRNGFLLVCKHFEGQAQCLAYVSMQTPVGRVNGIVTVYEGDQTKLSEGERVDQRIQGVMYDREEVAKLKCNCFFLSPLRNNLCSSHCCNQDEETKCDELLPWKLQPSMEKYSSYHPRKIINLHYFSKHWLLVRQYVATG